VSPYLLASALRAPGHGLADRPAAPRGATKKSDAGFRLHSLRILQQFAVWDSSRCGISSASPLITCH